LIDEYFTTSTIWRWSLSTPCILEYEEILLRQGFSKVLVEGFLSDLVVRGDKIVRVECVRPLLRDPDDEMIAELTLAAEAEYLITFNKKDFFPLLSLGVKLANPAEFLKILEKRP